MSDYDIAPGVDAAVAAFKLPEKLGLSVSNSVSSVLGFVNMTYRES